MINYLNELQKLQKLVFTKTKGVAMDINCRDNDISVFIHVWKGNEIRETKFWGLYLHNKEKDKQSTLGEIEKEVFTHIKEEIS